MLKITIYLSKSGKIGTNPTPNSTYVELDNMLFSISIKDEIEIIVMREL